VNVTDCLVDIQNLNLHFGSKAVLQDISLKIHRGEIITLIGPNGAGKSCLAKLIVGLIHPSSGKLNKQPDLRLGYMPQHIRLNPVLPLTVRRFLLLANQPQRIIKTLSQVGVSSLIDRSLSTLSGGEFQRVLLARALIRDPDLLVLDEPAQGVDLSGQDALYALIDKIRDEQNCGVLLVSHDLQLVMAGTNTVVCLNQHICCSGSPEHVGRDPAFKQLFGRDMSSLALYAHQHDHRHNIPDEILPQPNKEKGKS